MEIEMALHPDVLAELEAASAARKRKDAELPCAAMAEDTKPINFSGDWWNNRCA